MNGFESTNKKTGFHTFFFPTLSTHYNIIIWPTKLLYIYIDNEYAYTVYLRCTRYNDRLLRAHAK